MSVDPTPRPPAPELPGSPAAPQGEPVDAARLETTGPAHADGDASSDPKSEPARDSVDATHASAASDVPQDVSPGRLSGAIPSIVVHRPGSTQLARASWGVSAPHFRAAPSDEDVEPAASVTLGERPGRPPWARIALALAICGPALWLGGVPVVVVPVFLGVVLLLWLRLCSRSPAPLRVPYGSVIGLIAATLTLLQWLPLPRALREWLAPELAAMSDAALAGSGVTAWASLSPVPGDSALEAARLLGLTALYIAAAQLSWRVSAALVAGLGSAVGLLGLVQAGLGVRLIYGFYQPSDVDPAHTPALLTCFVNPNHQAGLLLLGIFSAAALAVYFRVQALETSDPARLGRASERGLMALAGVAVQGVALLLSLSRGAMTALLLVAPIALVIAWSRDSRSSRGGVWMRRVLLLLTFAGLGALLARQSGAWAELATLAQTAEPGFQSKFRVAQDAVALIWLSPILGIGRGAFIDLFPAIDSQPEGVLHTHLESAPVAMLVEWGPIAGSAIGLGMLWWWIAAMYSSGGRHGRPRRIALCGVLALAIHSLGDFSLEFLGVAAPLCALAGSLSERRMFVQWPARSAMSIGGLAVAGALLLSLWALPNSWQRRERSELGEPVAATDPALLRTRPLDSGLHTRLAFAAMADGRWDEARARALVATRLSPHTADPWWLLSAAEYQLGHAEASATALARTLAVVRKPLRREVVDTLLARYPSADELAARMPEALEPWTLVMESIVPVAPSYAAILAAARNQVDRREPEVVRLQVRIALESQNPALARYHATLLRQLAPEQASSHLLLVRALRAFPVPREREIQDVIDLALARPLDDDAEVGLLEEERVASLLRDGSPESRARARELLPKLLSRPGDRAALQRRNDLREAAQAL